MAEIDVQPKKKSPVLWIIGLIIILALLFFLLRGCNDSDNKQSNKSDTTEVVATTVTDWDSIDFNSPNASYEEVTDRGIQVRGNDKYSIYSLGENILFDTDQSTIQSSGEQQLQQISASLKKRFDGASIAVYGHTDSIGTAGHNAELGAQRAEAVKNWLVEKAGISADQISVHSRGESAEAASNETGAGRQLNRNVQIVAMAN
jgi:outer membrane protein OmpA-like peptidoglycan-associated protein